MFRRKDYPKFHKVLFLHSDIQNLHRATPRKNVVYNRVFLFEKQFFSAVFKPRTFRWKKNSLLSSSIPAPFLLLFSCLFRVFFQTKFRFLLSLYLPSFLPSFLVSRFFCKTLSDFFQGLPFPRISLPSPASAPDRPVPQKFSLACPPLGSAQPNSAFFFPAPVRLTVRFQFIGKLIS